MAAAAAASKRKTVAPAVEEENGLSRKVIAPTVESENNIEDDEENGPQSITKLEVI